MKRRKTIKWKTGCKKVLATMVAVSMFLTSSVGFAPEAVSAAVKTEETSAEEDTNTTLEVTSELSTEDSTSDTTEASAAKNIRYEVYHRNYKNGCRNKKNSHHGGCGKDVSGYH